MTQAEMRTLLRIYVDDVQGVRFTDEQCRVLLNVAYTEVYNRLIAHGLHPNVTTTTFTFSSTVTYNSLSDFQAFSQAVLSDSGTKIPMVEEHIAKEMDKPCLYIRTTTAGNTDIYYEPTPTAEFDVDFSYSPNLGTAFVTTSDNNYEIPFAFHNTIVEFARVKALSADMEQMAASLQMAEESFFTSLLSYNQKNSNDMVVRDVRDESVD